MSEETKKSYTFYIKVAEGFDCAGALMDEGLTIDVEFTDDEVAAIRQLIYGAKAGEKENLMHILEDTAPELYRRIDDAARLAMFDFYLVQEAQEYNIDFDEEEQQENFLKDLESGIFVPDDFIEESDNYSEVPEDDDELFDLWTEWEHNKFAEEDATWIRSRYTIDDTWIDVSNDMFFCYIPEEWLEKGY